MWTSLVIAATRMQAHKDEMRQFLPKYLQSFNTRGMGARTDDIATKQVNENDFVRIGVYLKAILID
jgi:hypothetical protein